MVYKTKVSWDATYDVIVIGFGGAGAGAARFAADNIKFRSTERIL